MFFRSSIWGLGGTQEDSDFIDTLIERACENGDVALWMYDTVTDSVKKVADSEECI